MITQIVLDFYKTLYNPKAKSLYRGVAALLQNLSQKYSLTLISAGGSKRERIIQKLDINKYFRDIVVCRQKTASEFASLITTPSQTLVIGDRKEEEIEIGKILGCKTLLVSTQKENPAITIQKYLQSRL